MVARQVEPSGRGPCSAERPMSAESRPDAGGESQRANAVGGGDPGSGPGEDASHEMLELEEQRLTTMLEERHLHDAGLPVTHALVREKLRVLDAGHGDILSQQVDVDVVVELGDGHSSDLVLPDTAGGGRRRDAVLEQE